MTAMMVGAGVNLAAGAAIGAASLAGARVPASLRCTTPPHLGFVYFDFNPKEISITRTSRIKSVASPGNGGSQQAAQKSDPAKITMNEVLFEGMDTKLRCDTLLAWTAPDAGFLGQLLSVVTGQNLKTQPPPLTFQWGPPMVGFMYTVLMQSVTVKYTRFTSAGIPVRAKLTLGFYEVPSMLGSLPQNPTSGGLVGRRAHTVGHGESLQSVATANYGNPGAWRRIAEINGIKDPTRVRPGDTVYLPNPQELADGGAR